MVRGFRRDERLSSWRTIALNLWDKPRDPTVYGLIDVDMTRALDYLEQLNSRSAGGAHATVTHLVVKAIARALAAHPRANAVASRRRLYLRDTVDVYCQVATDGGEDLTGVKVARADEKSVADIAAELALAVRRVHERRDVGSERTKQTVLRVPHPLLRPLLSLVEYLTYDRFWNLSRFGIAFDQFGSAMVSNVGGFGIANGLAPLVPASRVPIVLLVGATLEKPVAREGRVFAAPCATIGCTFDHRVIDGYQAGIMAHIVRATLENPFKEIGLPSRPSSAGDRISLARRDTNEIDQSGNACTERSTRSDPGKDPAR
jgi:pyruvate/2-oxoglutarate dehydrogenase complex dihydrolipoamide acyltransferase (E2) component